MTFNQKQKIEAQVLTFQSRNPIAMEIILTALDIELVNERVVELEAVKASQVTQESEEHDKNESVASDDSDTQPFEEYKLKIEDLLRNIGFHDFDVSTTQHSSQYEDYVYAFISHTDETEKYILRTPGMPELNDAGTCEVI